MSYTSCVLVAFVWLAVECAAQTAPRGGVQRMNGTEWEQLFRAHDWSAVQIAGRAGRSSLPAIKPYLRDKDEVVRLLAVDCIAEVGGTEAPGLLISGVPDPNEQVRIHAINALHRHLPAGREDELMQLWDASRSRDGYVRQQIPMILGRMHAQSKASELVERMAKDERQEVKDGLMAGLAKLGEPRARGLLGDQLRIGKGTRTAELIEFVKYIDEPWVIPLLVPVLQRRDIAVNISTHIRDVQRRDCDLAVDEVLRISKARFSFAIDPIAQYTDAQIAEVLQYARGGR